MTPKEKAKELVEKFIKYADKGAQLKTNEHTGRTGIFIPAYRSEYNAKQCAIIAVDEILNSFQHQVWNIDISTTNYNYWEQVKTEIENL